MKSDLIREVALVAAFVRMNPVSEDWTGIDAVWPLLERMRSEGAVVVLKLDGERHPPHDSGPYTVLASQGKFGEGAARTDADSIEEALAKVIVEYAERAWGYRAAVRLTHQ